MAEIVESDAAASSKRCQQFQNAQRFQNPKKKCRKDVSSCPQNHRFLPGNIRCDRSSSTASDATIATDQDQSSDTERCRSSRVNALWTGRCGKDLSCQNRRKDVWISAVCDRCFPRPFCHFTTVAAPRRPQCTVRFLDQTTELCDL